MVRAGTPRVTCANEAAVCRAGSVAALALACPVVVAAAFGFMYDVEATEDLPAASGTFRILMLV